MFLTQVDIEMDAGNRTRTFSSKMQIHRITTIFGRKYQSNFYQDSTVLNILSFSEAKRKNYKPDLLIAVQLSITQTYFGVRCLTNMLHRTNFIFEVLNQNGMSFHYIRRRQ